MVAFVNPREVVLDNATVRVYDLDPASFHLAASAPGFHVAADGQPTFPYVDITPVLKNLSGPVQWSAIGATLTNPTAASVRIEYIKVTGSSVKVTGQMTVGGKPYSAEFVLPIIKDGAAGTNGSNGSNGSNGTSPPKQGIAFLYKWSVAAPAKPTGTSTFTWAGGANTAYNGTDGYTIAPPTNPGTPLLQLFVATIAVVDVAAATSTTVGYASATLSAWAANGSNGSNGSNGANGAQAGEAKVYQWAATIPASPAGSPSFNWSDRTFGAAPTNWTLTPGAAPSPGMTLWMKLVTVVDTATATSTAFNWTSGSILAIGYAGANGSNGTNGGNGAEGVSYVTAYCASATVNTTTAPGNTTGRNSTPADNSGGLTGVYSKTVPTLANGQFMYQTDGLYNPANDTVVWSIPYWSSLKVGSLSAITANLGAITGGSIDIGSGTTSWHVDTLGSMWIGAATFGAAPFRVSNTGAAVATNLTLRSLTGVDIVDPVNGLALAYAPAGTKNSQISIGANGSLSGAGGGQVTLPGMGQNFFRIVGQGNQASAKVPAVPGLYRNGTKIVDVARSYTLVAIRRSDLAITHNRAYDVWGAGALQGGYGGPELASDLNYFADRPGQFILVVMTHDEPKLNKSGAVEAAMYRNGASRGVFGSPLFRLQSAYALVALSGCGEGNGAEAYQGSVDYDANAWIDVGFTMLGGELSSVSLNYVPKTLQDFGFSGDMNASYGAPSGSMVGGTDAGLVASRALNGESAYNALPDKVSKTAANILSGAGALISGTLTVDANGYRSGGYGTAQTQRGWVAYNSSGVLTFQLDAAGGSPYFAGQLAAAYGTLGGLRMAPGGAIMGGGYVAKQSPPSGQGGFFLDETLFALGNFNDGRYVFLHASGDIEAPGLSLVNKQLTLTNTILISPQIAKISGLFVSSPANSYYFTVGRNSVNAFAGAYELNLTAPDGTETFSFNAYMDNSAGSARVGGVNGKRANIYVTGNGFIGQTQVNLSCTVNRGGISSTFGISTTVEFQ